MKNFDEMTALVEPQPIRKVAVACGADAAVLQAAREALERNIAATTLVGDEAEIRALAEEVGTPPD
ncbi:MAG TPA: phosphate acyltransferase, partial [Phycisphaerae bacterium]|nr:phosphate acyltransferase [Phycisphaerae bacterium]